MLRCISASFHTPFFHSNRKFSSRSLIADSREDEQVFFCKFSFSLIFFQFRDTIFSFLKHEVKTTTEGLSKEVQGKTTTYESLKGVFRLLATQGAHGITVPSPYGLGLGYKQQMIAMEEIRYAFFFIPFSFSRVSPSLGLSYITHSNLCTSQLARTGTKQQKDKYLPKVNSKQAILLISFPFPF
jgi:alkylation response protein AidB-like acyl-CoA dehydrogenase